MKRRSGQYVDSLAEFSLSIRSVSRAFEHVASEAGMTPIECDLMLALRAYPKYRCPNIALLTTRLGTYHHVAAGAVTRLVEKELIITKRNTQDQRSLILALTAKGESLLRQVAYRTLEDLSRCSSQIVKSLETLAMERE